MQQPRVLYEKVYSLALYGRAATHAVGKTAGDDKKGVKHERFVDVRAKGNHGTTLESLERGFPWLLTDAVAEAVAENKWVRVCDISIRLPWAEFRPEQTTRITHFCCMGKSTDQLILALPFTPEVQLRRDWFGSIRALQVFARLTNKRASVANQPPEWKAGTASAVITPKVSMPMAGYAARKEPSEGTEQDLFAKAIVIEDRGGNRVVFITMDLIGVSNRLRAAVTEQLEKRYKLPPQAVVMNRLVQK